MTPVLEALARQHRVRLEAYTRAFRFVQAEAVDGDVLEFGTFAGASLALLAHASALVERTGPRRFAAFDSFEGLPDSADPHREWTQGRFARNEWWHPTIGHGERVTPAVVRQLFEACELPAPEIHAGWFHDTVPSAIPGRYGRVAVLHVDCDLYEAAAFVLRAAAPVLQDGAIVLFDDWYLYGGNPARGEVRAFTEFLAAHPEWGATDLGTYGTFSKAFILYRP